MKSNLFILNKPNFFHLHDIGSNYTVKRQYIFMNKIKYINHSC